TIDRNNKHHQKAMALLDTKQNLAKLLADDRFTNPGLWNWYARAGETLYHMGFDHSKAFTPDNIQALMAQPGFQAMVQRLGADPQAVQERLANLTKLEAFTTLLGATSIQTTPAENFQEALAGYRALVENRPLEETVALGLKADKGYAGLAAPEGLLGADYLKAQQSKQGILPDRDPLTNDVHPFADKIFRFAQLLREETDAAATYYQAIQQGLSPEEAAKLRELDRREIRAFVSDSWNRRGMLKMSARFDPEFQLKAYNNAAAERAAKGLTGEPQTSEDFLKAFPSGSQASWTAVKHFVYNELYPYLTGVTVDGVPLPKSATVHPQAAMFRQRYVNPAALQADLWARFRTRDYAATYPVLRAMFSPQYAQKLIDNATAASAGKRFQAQVNKRFQEVSPKEIQARTSNEESFLSTATNPKVGVEYWNLQPHLQSGSGYVTKTGEILERDPEATRQILSGTYTPLLQSIGDQLVKGSIQFGPNGPLISLTPNADLTTPIHEMLGHLFRRYAGPQDQQLISQRIGPMVQNGATNVPAEEQFAEGIENLLRTADPTDPQLRQLFENIRRQAGLAYFRNVPAGQLAPDLAQQVMGRIEGQGAIPGQPFLQVQNPPALIPQPRPTPLPQTPQSPLPAPVP
ncbi:hypothetical protein, partial [Nitrolancea hollandica]|uniref:hypothetical protein n=1 Tax=Nitrolancea hollandica TaxID=1206749 RepID=UPI00058D7958